jgi:dipeptidyl aminopeptidase/acylaminoacyl peptidase
MIGRILAGCLASAMACLSGRAAAAPAVEHAAPLLEGIPTAPQESGDRLGDYLNARRADPLGWSPQGQLLVVTRFGDTDQLHVVETAAGDRRQLTFHREPVGHGAFSPDPGRRAFMFLKDLDGNTQLYYQRVGEASAKMLTDGRSRNGGAVWSNFGREIAFFSSARDGATTDIDIVEAESGSLPRLAMAGDGAAWRPLDWSPDDRKLLVLKTLSDAESYLYVLDIAGGQKREVEPAPSRVRITDARFSRDGQGVYLLSDHDGEFAQLRYVSLFSAEKSVISAHIPWDVEGLALSRDGHYLAYVSNQGGAGRLNLLDLRTHQDLVAPQLPGSGVLDSPSFDGEGKHLAFGFGTATRPHDAFVLDTDSLRVEAWTRSEAGAVDLSTFVSPRLVQFPTFDRPDGRARRLAATVYEPRDQRPHPVLIVLGARPGGQFRPDFDPWIQYVVNELGFAVVAPDVRGCSGYGKTFRSLDSGLLRGDAVKDVGALLVWLGSQAEFDAAHVVISGSGYGGYLSLAALINYGDRLRGGIDFGGMVDFVDLLSGAEPRLKTRLRAEYGDERDADTRAFLRRISPFTGADRITKPVLVVQGRGDPLVPPGQSQQLVNRLRARGAEVWYLLADGKGGPFTGHADEVAYRRIFAQFLNAVR